MKALLKRSGLSSNSSSGAGSAAALLSGPQDTESLIEKVSLGQGDAVLELLKHMDPAEARRLALGVEADAAQPTDPEHEGTTLLHAAAESGNLAFVQFLLAFKGVNINCCAAHGFTPLHLASVAKHLQVCQALIAAGADATLVNEDHTTAMNYIVRISPFTDDAVSLLKQMLRNGAGLEVPNKHGETPLLVASARLNDRAVRCLLEHHAHVNHINNFGETALHKVVRFAPGDQVAVELAKMLLQHGMDHTIVGENGSALDLCSPEFEADFRELCITYGKVKDPTIQTTVRSPRGLDGQQRAARMLRAATRMRLQRDPDAEISASVRHLTNPPNILPTAGSSESVLRASSSALSSAAGPDRPSDRYLTEDEARDVESISLKEGFHVETGAGEMNYLDLRNIAREALPYAENFYDKALAKYIKHFNYVGFLDADCTDPCILSIRDFPERDGKYRALIRSGDGVNDVFVAGTVDPRSKTLSKDLLAAVKKDVLRDSKFDEVDTDALRTALMSFEENDPARTACFPVGVVLSKEGQTTAVEMFHNRDSDDCFEEFLRFLGQKVELQGWSGYSGGLDVVKNSRGTHSVYTEWMDSYRIMFHVSTMLPYDDWDVNKLQRSRMIGNDVVNIVFQEGCTTYDPATMPGAVSYVFPVVNPVRVDGKTFYRLSCARKAGVPAFKPDLPDGIFEANAEFRDLLLTKVINGHLAAQRNPTLQRMYTRPRQFLLEELVLTHSEKMKKLKAKADEEKADREKKARAKKK